MMRFNTIIRWEEEIILLLIGVIGVLMFVESYSFSWGGALLPRMASLATIIGCALLLIIAMINRYKKNENRVSKDNQEIDVERLIPNTHFVVLSTLFLVSIGYIFGLLISVPLYLLTYLIWFRQPWYVVISYTIFGIIIVYIFALYLNAPIEVISLSNIHWG